MPETTSEQELFFGDQGNGCFGCSRTNEHGLQLRFFRRGDSVVCRYTVPDRFHGAPKIAHGGIIAAILDEVSCAAAYHLEGEHVVTGELSVRYERPCPVEAPLVIVARPRERRAHYWIIAATVEREGEVLARSEGRFFPVDRPIP